MNNEMTRRDLVKSTLALAAVGSIGVPDWILPVMAQGEVVIPFTDWPDNFNANPAPDRRSFDTRTTSNPFTPANQFFTTQHLGHPVVDPATYKLRITGMFDKPMSLTLDEIKKMGAQKLILGFECSGNRPPTQGLIGNGEWTGVPLKTVLAHAGMKASALEVVFFGTDKGEEEVEWRTSKYKVEQQYGRSLRREKALSAEPFLAWALNGEPLTINQGFPLRLIVPGWYGAPNVKWLSQIHAQEDQYLGKFQARWYRTLKGEMIDGEMKWVETAVTKIHLKSFVARVTKSGDNATITGVVLGDGTPLKSVEIKIDDGPWQAVTMDPKTTAKYGWKLFTYTWKGAKPGEHTLVSRATDMTGYVQPTEKDLENKKSFLEHNVQQVRKITI